MRNALSWYCQQRERSSPHRTGAGDGDTPGNTTTLAGWFQTTLNIYRQSTTLAPCIYRGPKLLKGYTGGNLEARVGIEPAYTELQPGFSGDYLLLFIIMLHCLM